MLSATRVDIDGWKEARAQMTTTLNIRVSPRRMLSLREAADYCGISAKKLPTVTGISPVAMPDKKSLYDIKDLDRWLDSLKTNAPNSREAILAG
jgi:hypothetical protein